MSHTPHELHEEFPEHAATIHALKSTNARFLRLSDEYHEINRAIHRAETRAQPVAEAHEEHLRKQRMALKDEIARILTSSVDEAAES